jgi:D-amino-acid oxidase
LGQAKTDTSQQSNYQALIVPTRPETVVVGAGVIGLTTAIRLQEAGFDVRIVTRDRPADTTSAVAAAVWYPYEVHPKERVVPWSHATREALHPLTDDPDTGVSMTPFVELFDAPTGDPWWKPAVPSFRRATGDDLKPGYADGYVIDVPLMVPAVYLSYLERRFTDSSGTIDIVSEGIKDLRALEVPLVVNCTGLGARDLCDDDRLYPIRGQVVRVTNPGLTRGLDDDHGPLALTYIIPRRTDCIVGGTAEKGVWDSTPSDETTAAILERARTLEPRLHDADVLDVRTGLRPGRDAVRLEAERVDDDHTVIHNYGHGGAGYTLAWGCADEVVSLARSITAPAPG